jgi:hypothetical protein
MPNGCDQDAYTACLLQILLLQWWKEGQQQPEDEINGEINQSNIPILIHHRNHSRSSGTRRWSDLSGVRAV